MQSMARRQSHMIGLSQIMVLSSHPENRNCARIFRLANRRRRLQQSKQRPAKQVTCCPVTIADAPPRSFSRFAIAAAPAPNLRFCTVSKSAISAWDWRHAPPSPKPARKAQHYKKEQAAHGSPRSPQTAGSTAAKSKWDNTPCARRVSLPLLYPARTRPDRIRQRPPVLHRQRRNRMAS